MEVSPADAARAVDEVKLAVRMKHPNLVAGLHHALLDTPGHQVRTKADAACLCLCEGWSNRVSTRLNNHC